MKKIISALLCAGVLSCGFTVPASASDAPGSAGFKLGLSDFFYALFHKSEIVSSSFTGKISEDTFSPLDSYTADKACVLEKDADRDFTILNITDIHLTDYGKRVWMGALARATVRRLVRRVNPDLITVTGDFVCSESSVYAIKLLTSMMDGFGIPWAPVFGNHEAEGNCDLNFLADIMLESEHCLLKKGPAEMGVGNYIVNIAQREEDGSLRTVHSLIMMDTHDTHLWQNQIEWYEWAARGVSTLEGREIPSTVMFHIPCVEYQYAYDEAWDSEKGEWRDGFNASGELHEKICCHRDKNDEPINNGFFDAVKRVGTTKNIFCGHEHVNNFSVNYQGVQLTYTLKVGMGSGYRRFFNGGTVIKINSDSVTSEHIYSL